jgi:CDP-diacylglycerol--serine O-phosphatidyltransferase
MQKYFPVMQYINVPNFITTLGMAFGIGACHFVLLGDLKATLVCMFFAAIMDLLDGYFAGKLNQGTRFGQYVDSLTDFFICCALPALIALRFVGTHPIIFVAIIFYCACGLWRLAHFDVLLAENRDYFTGFPVPSGMGVNVFVIWFYDQGLMPQWACVVAFFVMGFLMISWIKLEKYGWWQKILALCGVIFIIAVVIFTTTN